MKNAIIYLSTLVMLGGHSAQARQGENDGSNDDGRTIKCEDVITQKTILQFHSSTNIATFDSGDFALTVKSRGDDIGEMLIIDKVSGDQVKAKRLEELLKVTLNTAENDMDVIVESQTHRGYAEAIVVDPNTADRAEIKSLSRRGQGRMEIVLISHENTAQPIHLVCEKTR